MADRTGHQSSLKKTVNAVHGAGEAIRGSINVMADRATGDHQAGSKNEAITRHGVEKMNQGRTTGTTGTHGHAGVPPTGVDPSKPSLVEQGEHPHAGAHSGYGTARGVNNNAASTNYGPHSSNVANKADPRVDSDLDNRGTHSTTAGQRGVGDNVSSSNYGPHSSNLANKADPRVDSDMDNRAASHGHTSGGYGAGGNPSSSNYGPHSSNMANKADPRVDSDLDNRGTHHTTSTHPGTGHSTGGQYGENFQSTNHGPHSSNLANKADPRVDSDRDNRAVHNTTNTSTGYSGAGHHATSGQHGVGDDVRSSNYGPHSSNLANKADPRVDSDMDNRGAPNTTAGGYTGGAPHQTGNYGQAGVGDNVRSSNHGPHSSNLANKADPRVDSDMDNRAASGGYGNTTSTGHAGGYGHENPGSTNHGPHSSNMANKADPRVDSDLDRRGGGPGRAAY